MQVADAIPQVMSKLQALLSVVQNCTVVAPAALSNDTTAAPHDDASCAGDDLHPLYALMQDFTIVDARTYISKMKGGIRGRCGSCVLANGASLASSKVASSTAASTISAVTVFAVTAAGAAATTALLKSTIAKSRNFSSFFEI